MKKVALLFATLCLCGYTQAQESIFKTSGTDAAFGRYELSYERTFNEGMNNIKSSGKLRKQGKWPNILTKSSFVVTFGHVNENIKQSFGKNLSFRVDTNSTNDHDGNPDNGVQIKYDNPYHSLQRDVIVKTKGFYLSGEYRSYIKTYNQKIGDAPRGWYVAPFLEVKFQNIDFNDETPLEINNAMAIILNDQHPVYYGDDLITGFWDFSVDNPNFLPGVLTTGDETSGQTEVFYNYLTSLGFIDSNGDGLIEVSEQGNPALARQVLRNSAGWNDVSHKYSEFAITGGLVIGRQWLFWDKLALDVQIGPQYKYLTRSKRVFNGNDTWNRGNPTGQAGDINSFINKYWDVFNPTNETDAEFWDSDRLANYLGLRDYDGNLISVRQIGDNEESQLRYNSGFNGDHNGLTDFGKLYTFRLNIKLGYAF